MNNRFEFYKDQYYFEFSRKDVLNRDKTLPIVMITGFLSGLSFVFSNSISVINSIWFWIMIPFIIASIFFGIKSCIQMYNAFKGANYSYLADPKLIYEYEKQLFNSNQNNKEIEFENKLKERMIESISVNRKSNKYISKIQYRAKYNIVLSLLFLIIGSTPTLIIKSTNKYSKQINIIMCKEGEKDKGNDRQIPEEKNEEKPTFPDNDLIMESHLPDNIEREESDSDSLDDSEKEK